MTTSDFVKLAERILETTVLELDPEAVVFSEWSNGRLEVKDKYLELRNRIYDMLETTIRSSI